MSDSDSDDSLLGETTFTSRSSSRVESNKKISLKSKFEALEAEATERMDKRIKVAQEMQQQTVTAQEERVTLTDSQLKDLEATLETAGQRRDRLREEEEEEEKLDSVHFGRTSMFGCRTLFTPLKSKKKRIPLKSNLPSSVKDALRATTKATTGPIFCSKEGKSTICSLDGDDRSFAESYLISASLTATEDVSRSSLTKLCLDLNVSTTLDHFFTYIAAAEEGEGQEEGGQGDDEDEENGEVMKVANFNVASLVCFLTLFTGTSKSDVAFLARLSGSSLIKGNVRTVFEGAWFRTVNGVEGNLGDMEGVEGLEGWSFGLAYAVIRNLPLYTATHPCTKSLEFTAGLCISYLNQVLNRPLSRVSNSSDATTPYALENNGLETAVTVLKVIESPKGKSLLSSDNTASVVGIVTVFVQACGALKLQGGRGEGKGGDTFRATWMEISGLCGSIKHGVQGTFMDEGARRLKEGLGLLEGYCRWRGERGLKKKEQKKLEMFQVGKEEEEKKGGDDGSNEDSSAPDGPPPSAEI
ncbi:hypothetical protein TrCOL_g4229 [Triparma columacea]|uniref:Uncharacterized protein n=1 Tax=Triparma columacea TaxID=722753 RepID=A0A9W7G204_9STRA|nr:hypothetical protein TrCOL_g4229 [Triparma columacea]